MPLKSPMFSPMVWRPLIFMPGSGVYDSNCAPSFAARSSNFFASSAVHQSRRLPSPSDLRPWSSKPWLISWPITAPIAP